MANLHGYHSRRDFSKTAEPRGEPRERSPGKTSAAALRYVIQKHAARRLHYDFRLELGGVLLSWAVPKGPSLDPQIKRLAVEVEPHPVEYGSFEGDIAEGQYGAGSVMLWDIGDWEPLDADPSAAYAKGHLSFALHGQKLKGAWHLVRTSRGDAKSWLLFKANDEHANPNVDILKAAPNSVVSGLTIEQFASPRAKTVSKPKLEKARPSVQPTTRGGAAERGEVGSVAGGLRGLNQRPDVEVSDLPSSVEVQLATLVDSPPLGNDWLHEIKFDGYRVIVRVEEGKVQLLTRKALDWTLRMPTLVDSIAQLRLPNVVLDGEFVALEPSGVSNFQMLQNSLGEREADHLVYYAFDLLHYAGVDTSRLPLLERKALLKEVLATSEHAAGAASGIRVSEHVVGSGADFFRQACQLGLEGMVSKRTGSAHTRGRSKDWLKLKCTKRQEFVVLGYTKPGGSRSHLGALLVGIYQDGELRYRGRVGTGFTQQSLALLGSKLKPLHVESHALANAPRGAHARGVHWVKPTLVAEVAYAGLTEDGILRHPTFQGLREDKRASDVTGEVAQPLEPVARASVDTSKVKLTNPTKVLYPNVGVTKRDLLEYAALVAPRLLPHVVDRPLTLVRCPNGEGKQCFFQKHPGATASGLRAVAIREKEGKADYAVIDDVEGLFSLVQLGVLEIHTSGAHSDDFEHPDVLVFDLDPDPSVEFSEVIRCARRIKEVFESAQLESFVKSTGGKGLHVCVPIEPQLTWPQAKLFTQNLANALVREEPTRYVATQSKAQRAGKIFIDYLRNGRGATFVAPYSMRARPTAPVATPLFWDELTSKSKPDEFTVQNLHARLNALSADPFERMATLRQTLPMALLRP